MLQSNYWIGLAFLVCIYLLWSAEHLTGPKEKLKRIWRNRVEWQHENTTLLRSSPVQINEKVGAVNITANISNPNTGLKSDCFSTYDGPRYEIVNINFKGNQLKIAVYKKTATQSDIVSNAIKGDKFWDKTTVNAILNNIDVEDTFVDIGANLGWFSILIASQGYTVHAIEPFTSNAKLLQLSMCLNPDLKKYITVHNHGLGVVSENCDLFQIPNRNIGDTHSICDKQIKQSFLSRGYKKIGSMNTKTLDDMVLHNELRLGNWILKIDTEGYEARIMRGAQNVLQSNPPHFIATEYTTGLLEGTSAGDASDYANILFNQYSIYDGERHIQTQSDIVGGNFELLKCYLMEPAAVEPVQAAVVEPMQVVEPVQADEGPYNILAVTDLEVLSVCLPGGRYSKEVVAASFINKDFWCREHNVTCHLYDMNHKPQHPKWDKLSRLIDILRAKTTKWVLWMDCDSMFTGMDPPNIFDSNYDIIASEDKNGVNLGVFVVQSRDSAIALINEMYNERDAVDTYSKFGWKDQEALVRVRKRHNVSIKIIPQKVLNSYYMNSAGAQWSEGDWIAHQVYCHRKDCNDNFVRMSKKIGTKDVQKNRTGA